LTVGGLKPDPAYDRGGRRVPRDAVTPKKKRIRVNLRNLRIHLNSGPIEMKNRPSPLPTLPPAKIGPMSDSMMTPPLTFVCQSLLLQSFQADPVSSQEPM
jgi:hypothetical protein